MKSVKRVAGLVAVAVLLLCTAGLVVSTFDEVEYQSRADEGYYMAYASRIAIQGPAGYPGLFTAYLNGLKGRYHFPNPLRIGTIALGAAAVKLGGSYFTNLSLLSLAGFMAVLMVMFVGTVRAFGWRTAYWTLLLCCAAPLHLALARRALSDTLVSAALLASLWLFLRAIWKEEGEQAPRRRWLAVAASFTAAFLVKEWLVLLVPTALFFLVWRSIQSGRPVRLVPALAVSVVPLALAGSAIALAAGGIGPVFQVAASFLGASINEYSLNYQQGPWYRFITDFMLVSAWPVLLYFIWVGVLIGERVKDYRIWFWTLVPALFLVMIACFPMQRNIRLIMFLEMPLRLCSVLLLQRLFGDSDGNRRATIGMAAAVLILMWIDLQSFYHLFVNGDIYDPIGLSLMAARRYLPL